MKKVIKIVNVFLFIYCICISYLIFINKNISFSNFIDTFNVITNYYNLGKNNKTVSSFPKYINIEDDKYYNENHIVYSIKNGVVISIGEDSIIIKFDDNYIGYYSNLINIKVFKYDVISSDDELANFDDYFNFYFIYNDRRYTYEEVMG